MFSKFLNAIRARDPELLSPALSLEQDALCAQRSGVGFVWLRPAYEVGAVLQQPVSASFVSYDELEQSPQRANALDEVASSTPRLRHALPRLISEVRSSSVSQSTSLTVSARRLK